MSGDDFRQRTTQRELSPRDLQLHLPQARDAEMQFVGGIHDFTPRGDGEAVGIGIQKSERIRIQQAGSAWGSAKHSDA